MPPPWLARPGGVGRLTGDPFGFRLAASRLLAIVRPRGVKLLSPTANAEADAACGSLLIGQFGLAERHPLAERNQPPLRSLKRN